MSYLKTLTSKDVIVTPFTVHKPFSRSGALTQVTSLNGLSSQTDVFFSLGYSTTTQTFIGDDSSADELRESIYFGIQQLYYGNYIGDGTLGRVSNAATASFNPDGTISGPRYTTNYINNIQSIDEKRFFPVGTIDDDDKGIIVISIPSKLYGNYIKPGSVSLTVYFTLSIGPLYLVDDGQGNIFRSSDNRKWGNIIYDSGLIIITNKGEAAGGLTKASFQNSVVQDLNWESTVTMYETQYKCTIRANEYNCSLNPSLLSGSIIGQNNILNSGSATYEDFVTGSDFTPYVTTVGLYNNNQELLAVAKLAQPLPTSQTTDTTILVNLDR